jgi:probable HAF family extracellular repeat protein
MRASAIAIPLLCAMWGPAEAATFTSIDPPGAVTTYATAINDQGVVTGSFVDSANAIHGFVRATDGSFTTFDLDGIAVNGINNKGWVVGSYQRYFGFIRKPNGHVTSFTVDQQHDLLTTGINAQGDVCGILRDSQTGADTGFVRSADGTLQEISLGSPTDVLGINDSGTVTGYYVAQNVAYGFVRTADGAVTSFSAGNAPTTLAYAINAAGTVAGAYWDANDTNHAFVRDPSGNITLFDVGKRVEYFPIVYGASINARGEIAGYYDYDDEYYRGFIRAPNGEVHSFDAKGVGVDIFTEALGINRRGAIVGIYQDQAFATRGYLRTP